MRTLAILLFGALLGMRHAMEADHLAAVATLVARVSTPRHAAIQGALWGLGHALALVAFAGVVVVIGAEIPASVATGLELLVAAMLIALGIDVMRRGRRAAGHARDHAHHAPSTLRPVAVGVMHGLSGSAALVLLALSHSASRLESVGYVAIFGLGSIVGMALLSFAVALPMRASTERWGARLRIVELATGVGTIALGVVTAWRLAGDMITIVR